MVKISSNEEPLIGYRCLFTVPGEQPTDSKALIERSLTGVLPFPFSSTPPNKDEFNAWKLVTAHQSHLSFSFSLSFSKYLLTQVDQFKSLFLQDPQLPTRSIRPTHPNSSHYSVTKAELPRLLSADRTHKDLKLQLYETWNSSQLAAHSLQLISVFHD